MGLSSSFLRFVEQAIELAEEAIEADECGRVPEAIEKYQNASMLFSQALRGAVKSFPAFPCPFGRSPHRDGSIFSLFLYFSSFSLVIFVLRPLSLSFHCFHFFQLRRIKK